MRSFQFVQSKYIVLLATEIKNILHHSQKKNDNVNGCNHTDQIFCSIYNFIYQFFFPFIGTSKVVV